MARYPRPTLQKGRDAMDTRPRVHALNPSVAPSYQHIDESAPVLIQRRRDDAHALTITQHLLHVVNHADLDFAALFSGFVLIGVWGIPDVTMALRAGSIATLTWGMLFITGGFFQIGALVVSRANGQYRLRCWSGLTAAMLWTAVAMTYLVTAAWWPIVPEHLCLAAACLNGFRRFLPHVH